MEEKKYAAPDIKVIEIDAQSCILAGSNEGEGGEWEPGGDLS